MNIQERSSFSYTHYTYVHHREKSVYQFGKIHPENVATKLRAGNRWPLLQPSLRCIHSDRLCPDP